VSGVVLDARAGDGRPSFLRLLWAVVLGYIGASITLGAAAIAFDALGLLPRPYLRPGPFAVTGAWSLDADIVIAVAIVLVAAWWIRGTVAARTDKPVSFGIVACVVAVTGFAPYLALRPVALTGLLALLAATWLVRRYAIERTLSARRLSWRVWVALGVAGLLVFSSYRVYHPLSSPGTGVGGGSDGSFRVLVLNNSGFADLTVTHVEGGALGGFGETAGRPRGEPWGRVRLPYELGSRSSAEIYVAGPTCRPRTVTITYSVLGRTSTEQFSPTDQECNR
jgi:hypothetical protein